MSGDDANITTITILEKKKQPKTHKQLLPCVTRQNIMLADAAC